MNFFNYEIRHRKFQYKVLGITLALMLVFGKHIKTFEDAVVGESFADAEVISVTVPQAASSGVGANMTFATVELESGERARISISGLTPSAGEQIRVKTTTHESGKIKVSAADLF